MTKGKWGSVRPGWPSHYFLEGDDTSVCGVEERKALTETGDVPGYTCPICNRIFNFLRVSDWLENPKHLEAFLRRVSTILNSKGEVATTHVVLAALEGIVARRKEEVKTWAEE